METRKLTNVTPTSICVDRKIINHLNSLDAAVILAVLQRFEDELPKNENDWFPATYGQIKEITCMGTKRLRSGLNVMRDLGVIETRMVGLPAMMHYRINRHRLLDLIGD